MGENTRTIKKKGYFEDKIDFGRLRLKTCSVSSRERRVVNNMNTPKIKVFHWHVSVLYGCSGLQHVLLF